MDDCLEKEVIELKRARTLREQLKIVRERFKTLVQEWKA
jgi:hypothetical protein